MANPQVTITLGRSGQKVVKDSWGGSGGIPASEPAPSVSKRSMPDSFAFDNNKRMRNDMSGRSHDYSSSPLDGNDSRLDPNDLRSKLTQKRISREMELQKHERKKMELYEKVSKAIRSVEPPNSDKVLRSKPSETPKMGSMISPFASWPSNEPPDHKQYRTTHSTREANEFNLLASWPSNEPPDHKQYRTTHSTREANEFNLLASWPSNGAGARFSDRIPQSSSGIPTPRSAIDEMSQLSSLRQKMESWGTPLVVSSMHTVSRCPSDSGMLVKEFPPASGGMSLPPLQPLHVPRESQPLTVRTLLHSLGLGKYYINFQAEEIDMAILRQMGEGDLKELGIPMGPRKKIFLAVQARMKRPVTQPQNNYLQNS